MGASVYLVGVTGRSRGAPVAAGIAQSPGVSTEAGVLARLEQARHRDRGQHHDDHRQRQLRWRSRERRALCRWAKCSTSLTPMKPGSSASPVDRYTSRSSSPETRKNSARRPSSANALADEHDVGVLGRPRTRPGSSPARTRSRSRRSPAAPGTTASRHAGRGVDYELAIVVPCRYTDSAAAGGVDEHVVLRRMDPDRDGGTAAPRSPSASSPKTRNMNENASSSAGADRDESLPAAPAPRMIPIVNAFGLLLGRHRERADDHQEHEQVVDRQALLDDVAGEVLAPRSHPAIDAERRPRTRSARRAM